MAASAERIETAQAAKARTAGSANAERLRIAVVTPELHRKRGTERVTSEMVVRLAAEHDVHVFAHYFRAEDYPGVQFHSVPVLPWPGLATFLSFYYVSESVVKRVARRAGAFDVVYSPGPNSAAVDVATAHFCQAKQLELFRSGKHRPPPATPLDWAKLTNRWLYARLVAGIETSFYRSRTLRRVLTQSELLAQDLHRYYGLPKEKTVTAYPGVDLPSFSPEARESLRTKARKAIGLGETDFVFAFLGNNWLIKGLYNVLHAMAQLPDAMLIIVGADFEPPASWEKLARKLGVLDRLTFLPRRTDVIFYYAAADALLAPSVYDTFGLMPLEAMACGLPCVITRGMGVAEIVSSNEAIVLENGEDAAALARAMRGLMNDEELRAKLVANGIELAQRHTWEGMYAATLDELACAARTASAMRRIL